jgi:hypothetical protein
VESKIIKISISKKKVRSLMTEALHINNIDRNDVNLRHPAILREEDQPEEDISE